MTQIFLNMLNISYDGDGEHIQNHQMNAKYVAESLLALNNLYFELFKESNIIHNDNIKIDVLLDAGENLYTFEAGSLKWLLRLVGKQPESQTHLDKTQPFHEALRALKNVVDLLKRFRHDDASIEIKKEQEGYSVKVDGQIVTIKEIEYAILSNEKVRMSLSKIVEPLIYDGIDNFTLTSGSKADSFSINKGDANNLYVSRSHKTILEEGEFEGIFYIETLSYDPEQKWKLVSKTDKSKKISAIIADTAFLKRVSMNQERFSKDDLLNVKVTWYSQKAKYTGKAVYTYTIIDVLEHIPVRGSQGRLL